VYIFACCAWFAFAYNWPGVFVYRGVGIDTGALQLPLRDEIYGG